jgi:hypothetical protein
MASSDAPRFDPFDVVVVPFPYADRLAEKRRPALVISNRKLAARGNMGGDDHQRRQRAMVE